MSGALPLRDGDPPHVVDDQPFPPPAPPAAPVDGASPFGQFWRRFRRRRLAYIAFWLLAFMYLVVVPFAEFLAPYGRDQRFPDAISHPPQLVRLWGENGPAAPFAGEWRFPFVSHPHALFCVGLVSQGGFAYRRFDQDLLQEQVPKWPSPKEKPLPPVGVCVVAMMR